MIYLLRLKTLIRSCAVLAVCAVSTAPALAQEVVDEMNVYGVFINEDRTGIIEVEDCGDGTPCGTLIWVTPYPDGSIVKDDKNPDPELAAQPLIGTSLFKEFEAGKGKWKSGRIYNPEDGKTYRSSIKLSGHEYLEVKGCLGPICKTQYWNRLPVEVIKP